MTPQGQQIYIYLNTWSNMDLMYFDENLTGSLDQVLDHISKSLRKILEVSFKSDFGSTPIVYLVLFLTFDNFDLFIAKSSNLIYSES